LADTERDQRRHAVGQQAIVDIKNGPFVHAPSSHPRRMPSGSRSPPSRTT
jgi:hypothetical protein